MNGWPPGLNKADKNQRKKKPCTSILKLKSSLMFFQLVQGKTNKNNNNT